MKDSYERPQVVEPEAEAELVFVPPEGTPFYKKLLIYCGVWLVLIGIACALVWSIADQYEKAQPSTAMDEFIISSRQDMFFHAISEEFNKIDNQFESAYDSASTLSKKYIGELTYTKLASEYTTENPVYVVKHDGENLFKVTLEQDEKTGFMGFRSYYVRDIELLEGGLFTLSSYNLVFASNMLVHINNTPLGTDLSKYEKIDVFGDCSYRAIKVENFTSEPKIISLLYRNEGAPEKVVEPVRVGNYYIFNLEDEPLSTLTVTVPEGTKLSIDNKEVSDFFISESFVSEDEASTRMCVYTIPTVYRVKTLSATLGGKPLPLVKNGELAFSASPETATYEVTVPFGATLLLSGNAVDSTYAVDNSAVWHSDFEDIASYPAAVKYAVETSLSPSAFTASVGGTKLISVIDGETIVFTYPSSEELKEKHSENATAFVEQYLYYSTQGYRNTETNLANTLALVVNGSPLYKYLNLANVGIEYKSPQSMELEYIRADNFIPYGEDAFTCEVSYKATLNDSLTEIVEENVIRLIYIRSQNTMLPAKFILY